MLTSRQGHPPPEIYHRWVAYGLFSSHSRLHGSSSYRVPWQYGEEAATYMAKYLDAKHSEPTNHIVGSLAGRSDQALQSNKKGHPIQRAMFLEFLSDRTTHHLDQQYMLGPSLLVAPVFVPDGEESEYYLPTGRWTSFFHPARTVVGPVWVKEVVPIDEIPVWVRPGSVLCLGPPGKGRPDYEHAEDVSLQIYEIAEGQSMSVEVPVGKGRDIAGVIKVERKENVVSATVTQGSVGLSAVTLFANGRSLNTTVDKETKTTTLRL
ncbi:hypothetical protein NM688_g8435 [Phlebia brevispora]|uniref:Uncharacterized protein n=1 Tax=Phlebia brevispora TaxID=194682 RepID=A0ACC1RRG8_9APHY|nr:hypothetical protein NM688_g8435 [Phlebia brevispora]